MHIAEGFLPLSHAAVAFAVAAPLVALGYRDYRRLPEERRPLVALLGAGVFVVSLLPIPVPVVGSCSHPCGTPLAGILLGPRLAAFVAAVALGLHALLFAHGGATTLGANALTLGVLGGAAGAATFHVLRRAGLGAGTAAGVAGTLGDLATYAGVAALMGLSVAAQGGAGAQEAGAIILGFLPAQGPLAIVEGLVTAAVVRRILARRPDLLLDDLPPAAHPGRAIAVGGVLLALASPLIGGQPARAQESQPSTRTALATTQASAPASPAPPPRPEAGGATAYGDLTDTVLGGVAARAGREQGAPLLDLEGSEVGRLLLLAGGAIAGFIAGSAWRSLGARPGSPERAPDATQRTFASGDGGAAS